MTKYQSRYSPDKLVTAAQYITELICEKKAKLAGGELPVKFWELKNWGSFYRQQIHVANGLLRIYAEQAIIRGLNNPIAAKVYSLRAPQLDAIFKSEQARFESIEAKRENAVPIERIDVSVKPRELQAKKTTLSKLKDL